jgi:hypothetical protein
MDVCCATTGRGPQPNSAPHACAFERAPCQIGHNVLACWKSKIILRRCACVFVCVVALCRRLSGAVLSVFKPLQHA